MLFARQNLMFPRVIALLLSLLGASPLMAQSPDSRADEDTSPRLLQASSLFDDPAASPPQAVEIREQHVRVPTIDLTIEPDDLWERMRTEPPPCDPTTYALLFLWADFLQTLWPLRQ